jgi:hypothetical protein
MYTECHLPNHYDELLDRYKMKKSPNLCLVVVCWYSPPSSGGHFLHSWERVAMADVLGEKIPYYLRSFTVEVLD